MKNEVLKGSIILVFAGVLSKIFGAFFRVPLTNIIGVEGMGAFQMIMSIYSFCLILCSGGVTIALSKVVAESEVNSKKVSASVKVCLFVGCLLGLLVGSVVFLLKDEIVYIQGAKEVTNSYIFIPFLILLGTIIACLRGIAQGKGNMKPTAVSQILEQMFKFLLGLAFASLFVRYGVEWGVFGGFLGITLSEIFATVYLLVVVKLPRFEKSLKIEKGFLKILIPIYLSSLIFPLVNALDSILISRLLIKGGIELQNVKILFGLESGVVSSMLNIPLIISSSIATTILPNFASIKEQKDVFNQKVKESGRTLWLILIPTVMGIMAICPQLYGFLYPNFSELELSYAINLTRFGGILTIFSGIMQYIITIMEINDKLYKVFLFECFGGIINIVSLIILCPIGRLNIYGLLIAKFLMVSSICLMGLASLKKVLYFEFKDFCLPIISGIAMFCLIEMVSRTLNFSQILNISLLVFVGFVTYICLSFPTIRDVLKKNEIFKQKNKTLD